VKEVRRWQQLDSIIRAAQSSRADPATHGLSPHLVDDSHQRDVEAALPEGLDRAWAVEAPDPDVQLTPEGVNL
jgi:hypothetical protein